jgi:hypothetical protein
MKRAQAKTEYVEKCTQGDGKRDPSKAPTTINSNGQLFQGPGFSCKGYPEGQ